MTWLAAESGGGAQLLLGLLLALTACLATRLAISAAWRSGYALLLEWILPVSCFALIASLTARPVFAGLATLLLGAGYGYADRAKYKVLAEPIVFTDVFQAFDIFRHPHLALPFPRLTPVLLGVLAGLSFFALIVVMEPPAWEFSGLHPLGVVAVLLVVGAVCLGPCRHRIARGIRRLRPSGELRRDSARYGPLGSLLLYGLLARGEREQRRAVLKPQTTDAPLTATRLDAGPLVLVQAESFFDVRRLHPALGARLLPHWSRLLQAGAQAGRLSVPSWGANTVRTEFSVLSGLPEDALGYDRFNPYHRFVSEPVDSLAWQMRRQGYHTICLHPFDRSFYSRDRVLPLLGFDRFIGEEAFAGAARVNGFVADVEVARYAAGLLASEGPRLFLFIITMENHGPWSGVGHDAPNQPLAAGLDLPQRHAASFERYLHSLNNTDAMLPILCEALDAQARQGVLAMYGDHLPAFAGIFSQLQLQDLRSDYLIWRSGAPPAARQDLAAYDLRRELLRIWSQQGPRRAAEPPVYRKPSNEMPHACQPPRA